MQEQLVIQFKGKNYTSKQMTVGNFINLMKMKSIVSDGQYGSIWRMTTGTGDEALLMIDIEAFITVFFPEMVSDLKVPIKDLGLKDYKDIKQLYTEKMFKWVDRHMKILNDVESENKEE